MLIADVEEVSTETKAGKKIVCNIKSTMSDRSSAQRACVMWFLAVLRLRATMKWAWFQIKFLGIFPSNVQDLLTTFKTVVFQRFYRLLVAQEMPWIYLHTQCVIAGFSFQFSRQLSKLVRSHMRQFSGNPITAGLPRDWRIFFQKFWMVVKIFTVYYTKVYLPPSVHRAVSIDQYYILIDFWLHAQIKKADAKNCTKNRSTCCSNLHAGIHCYVHQHVTRCTVARSLKQCEQAHCLALVTEIVIIHYGH